MRRLLLAVLLCCSLFCEPTLARKKKTKPKPANTWSPGQGTRLANRINPGAAREQDEEEEDGGETGHRLRMPLGSAETKGQADDYLAEPIQDPATLGYGFANRALQVKNDEPCIQNAECCISKDEFCIQNRTSRRGGGTSATSWPSASAEPLSRVTLLQVPTPGNIGIQFRPIIVWKWGD